MDPQKRNKIFQGLKSYPGWIARMHEKTKHLKKGGFHRNHFYNVFTGQRKDHYGVIMIGAELLLDLTEERYEKEDKLDQALAKVDKIKEAS